MANVVPNESEKKLLDLIATVATRYKLWTNDLVPDATHTAGNYVECSLSGYSYQSPTWNTATTSSGKALITASDVTFSASTGTATCYGITCTNTAGDLLWVDRFATAKTLSPGNTIVVSPKFTASSEN